MTAPATVHDDLWRLAAARLIDEAPADHRDDLRIIFGERAGICEHDGGLSRPEAERTAFGELRRLLATSLAASVPVAVVERFDGGDVEQRQKRPLVGPRLSDKHFGLQQGDAVRVADGERLAPGREDAEGVERVAVEQFDDRVPCAHTQSIAADGPDGQGAAIAYRPPEAWDKADVAVWEAGQGLRPIWTATSGTPAESVPGVPIGWSRESWVRRLEYMIGVCVVPERQAELRRMLEKVR